MVSMSSSFRHWQQVASGTKTRCPVPNQPPPHKVERSRKRGRACPVGTEKGHELAGLYREIDLAHGRHIAIFAVEQSFDGRPQPFGFW